MKKKNERDNMKTLSIDEEGIISGDIEAIRHIFHKSRELDIEFDMAPYCG